MFDYKISKHPHFDEACRAFALRHNMAKLAELAGTMALPRKLKHLNLFNDGNSGAGKSVVWLGRLMMANPILAAISLIAMGAIYIWQNWETLGPKFRALWEAVSNGVSAAWAIVRQTISQKWTEIISDIAALPEKFKAMGSAIIDSVLDGINEKWEALKSKLASVTDYLPDWMTGNTTTTPQVQIVGAATPRPIPPGGSFAGMYDSGGAIPRGQFGIVGENGPEIVNGPANVTSRRRTAALASVVAGVMGVTAAPAETVPLHPFSLPVRMYQPQPVKTDSPPTIIRYEINAPIHITAQPGQSAQDIAREVARQLDERERRARAKARSNFSDQGGYES